MAIFVKLCLLNIHLQRCLLNFLCCVATVAQCMSQSSHCLNYLSYPLTLLFFLPCESYLANMQKCNSCQSCICFILTHNISPLICEVSCFVTDACAPLELLLFKETAPLSHFRLNCDSCQKQKFNLQCVPV